MYTVSLSEQLGTHVFRLGNMRITESLEIENDRKGYQELCSDCEAYGLKKHRLMRSDGIPFVCTH